MAPRLMAGRILETDGTLEEAKRYFEGILKLDPHNKEANARVGKILAKQGSTKSHCPILARRLTAMQKETEQ